MHNFPSTAPGDAHIDAVHLYRLWDAEEDRHYAHTRDWPTWDGQQWASPVTDAQTGLVAVRTPDGEGRVTTQAGQTLTLTRDTVLILPWADLASWRTTDDHWRLWWFEFFMLEPAHAKPYTPLDLPYTDAEEARIKAIQRDLRKPDEAHQRLASANFAALLYGWAAQRAVGTDVWVEPRRAVDEGVGFLRHLRQQHFHWRGGGGAGVPAKENLAAGKLDERLRCSEVDVVEGLV